MRRIQQREVTHFPLSMQDMTIAPKGVVEVEEPVGIVCFCRRCVVHEG